MLLRAVVLALAFEALLGHPVDEEKPFDFSQHKLIRIRPTLESQLYRLHELHQEFDTKVDFWNHPMTDMRPVLTLISPEGNDFLKALNSSNIRYEVATNNFQKLVDKEREDNQQNKALFETKAFDYDNVYHKYDEIVAELKALPTQSSKATYFKLGTTYEGREIPAVVITNSGGSNKQAVILECGIHSREWVSTASCLWIANQLLTVSSNDGYLNKYEFVIVPTLNADGYVYTWTTNRMWRKTRTRYGSCYGADPNRNWDAAHCQTGASTNQCSDTYCGPSPFSEPCAKAMADMMTARKGKIAAYFAIHSYSQLWMYPYGYANKLPPNSAQLASLSSAAVTAIKNTNGLTFKPGPIATTIYIASGSSIDWALDKLGVAVSFALELRDTGYYGFQLPANQIKPGSAETWAGIRAVLDNL